MFADEERLLTSLCLVPQRRPWHQGLPSQLYTKKSHFELREWVLKWVEDNVMDVVDQWEGGECIRGAGVACSTRLRLDCPVSRREDGSSHV